MKLKLLLISASIAIIALAPRLAFAGGDVGNGGGTSEKFMIYAYLHLGNYIRVCLDSSICDLSPVEHKVLEEIKNSLHAEYKTHHQIQFLNGKTHRAFFTIDGLIREAATGNRVGDPVYINTDQLYSAKGRPITLGFAIATLVHEFAHHHGVKDSPSDLPDILGEKVARVIAGHTLTSQTYIDLREDVLTATFYDIDSSLLVSDKSNFLNESHDLKNRIQRICYPSGVLNFYLDGLNWGMGHWAYSENVARVPLTAVVGIVCKNNQMPTILKIEFRFSEKLTKYAPFRFSDHITLHNIEAQRVR